MYYSDELVEEVRSRSDIVDIIGGYVHLQKKGSNYFGLCPFHNEKSPSFSVSASKQIYYCFGCGKGGNVIGFVMEYENESFQEALKQLADRAGIALPEQSESLEERQRADYRSILLAIQKEAATFFYYQLKSPVGALGLAYLKNRGLSDETIKGFGLGYADQHPRSLYEHLKGKGYTDRQLADSGLVKIDEKGAYDKFWNRVMFPIMDVNNKVIGFGGRVMGDAKPKYLNSPETMIFDKSRSLYGLNVAKRTRKPYFLICEGYMDVISLHQAGFTNAVAALGTAFTVQHGLLIKRYTKEVILTFDSDGAGIKAALRAIPIVKEAGLTARVLTMKPYKDPDEFISKMGTDAYQKRIDEAKNAFMFEIENLRSNYDFSDPSKKTEFFDEACKRLLEFSDPLERNNYIEAVANEYGMDYNVLKDRVRATPVSAYNAQPREDAKPSRAIKREKDEGIRSAQRLILTWLAENPGKLGKISDILISEDFTDELYRRVASILFEQIESGRVNISGIPDLFIDDAAQQSEVARIFNASTYESISPEDEARALREAILRIKRHSLDEQYNAAQDIAQMQQIMDARKKLSRLDISFE